MLSSLSIAILVVAIISLIGAIIVAIACKEEKLGGNVLDLFKIIASMAVGALVTSATGQSDTSPFIQSSQIEVVIEHRKTTNDSFMPAKVTK